MGNTGAGSGCCHDIAMRNPSVNVIDEGGTAPVLSARKGGLHEEGPGFSDRTDSTDASSAPDVGDVGQAQQVVKAFVRSLVKGQSVNVVAVTGGVAECIVSLDRKLTTLSLQRSGKKEAKKRPIPLENVCEICVGQEVEHVELPVDERCVTLVLEDGSAIGFQFEDMEERDTFALCLSMFVDGRRGEVQRKTHQN